ncbi:DUF1571 domain-containing protein [Gimesia aquarii]|uniref:DUF1571 domain-containing protein n=1 Tax=Gimesia aquarii TaxID=2527964 RepID=A0A517W343_9PLAN|nr:DUF1571 domain-containing protein [Gimesia aquarii]QDT99650.1 hypothetical protein V144x_51620 [Gimesia aquarii]
MVKQHTYQSNFVLVRQTKKVAIMAGLMVLSAITTLTQTNLLSAADAEHPLDPAIRLAMKSYDTTAQVKDFEGTFIKREKVGRRMQPTQTMKIKFREKPLSVYLHFQKPHTGREVIYFQGRNGNQILAHETGIKGLVGTISLQPNSPQAMDESRYPITTIGIRKMLFQILKQWKEERQVNAGVNVKYFPDAKLGNMQCKVLETSYPQQKPGLRFQMTRLYIDKATNLPVRVEQYDWPTRRNSKPELVEEYTYTNIRTNAGLNDADFDPKNPAYNF